jgi:Type I phosphodiesterase / nucleotide pyrophosphatase
MTGQGIEVRVAFRNMVRALGFVGVAGILAMFWAGPVAAQTQTQTKTRNVVLIVSDGLRWQEMFTGADATLMDSEHGGIWADPGELRKKFWRDDVAARREALFPFLWGTVAKQGEIFGNQNRGSVARVTNGMAFSYPGYNEMISGHPDPRIDSNEFGPNPNLNVFEWLDHLPDLRGQAAVYGTWSVFKNIFNVKRSGLAMQVGWDLPEKGALTPRQQLLNELYETTTKLDDEDVYDSFLQVPLLEYVKAKHPRVLFVGYGETDNWAHSGRYDLVLDSAHQFDHFVEQLWNTMQSMPEYRGQTTFILTTDHGRGSGLVEWKEHGVQEKGSESIWIGVLGPDTPALGERTNVPPVAQSQIAATVAALLGKDYRKDVPVAAEPLPVIESRRP